MTFDRRVELGEFLRSRRARLRPEEFGLPFHGRQRRVPGLRREELAQLAGISVDHYVRLEQGRSLRFSAEVLDAVARVLRLDPAEREHLHRLARPAPAMAEEPVDSPPLRRGVHSLLAAIDGAPAYVVDRTTDVRAWNRLAAAFIADFGELSAAERNMARLVFLDHGMRDLYVDWWARARDVVAFLRLDMARPPAPAARSLIEELSAASPEFRQIWAEHDIKAPEHGSYRYRHPLVGELELTYETLRLPGHPDLALVVHTAEEGSPAEEALRVLARS
ncbi:helix-turn-helix transcriptional regulator [Actinomadura kijaniata]|uniref:helix-turn-helix transcriptional regulator n=1 Tax=Actinomadura kijaniata TaxID=46161 RepID=UPI00082FDDAE|nr:helix-turn-helix transcriptional regulator [Actinomadura kijaniata]